MYRKLAVFFDILLTDSILGKGMIDICFESESSGIGL